MHVYAIFFIEFFFSLSKLQHLEVLKLKCFDDLSEDVYLNFIPRFGNLQILDVSCTNTGDCCLLLLGTYCKDLT